MNLLPFDIAWMAIILCGIPILVGAFKGVICEHDIKADLLVSLALIASVATKEFFAAGEVALIMQIGSLLEDYTSGKAREGIEKLINIRPQTARVLRDEIATEIPVEQVKVGDVISVIAGETVPVDGTILEGETSIDQSVIKQEDGADPLTYCYKCIKMCVPGQTLHKRALIASVTGDVDEGLVFAGYNAARLTEMTTVPKLMEELVREAEEALDQ